MKCPRDEALLAGLGPDATFGVRCDRCSGVLLLEKQFMRSTGQGARERLAAVAGLASLQNLAEGSCRCPRDGTPMRLLRFREVELDICPACHSVWLDAGEQSKVAAIIRKERREAALAEQAGNAGGQVIEEVGVRAADGVIDFVFEAVGSILDGISL